MIIEIYLPVTLTNFQKSGKWLKQAFIDDLFQIQVLINGWYADYKIRILSGRFGKLDCWGQEDQILFQKVAIRESRVSNIKDWAAEEDRTAIEV